MAIASNLFQKHTPVLVMLVRSLATVLVAWSALGSPGPTGNATGSEGSIRHATPATAADSLARHAVVVELFTSQGCSSCPPADRLLSKLGQEAGGRVVPLAFHVDFWNHGGWKDPFSRHEWTERQVAYARALGMRQVYTPQAIVDGRVEMVGSQEDQLRSAISAAASRLAAGITLELETLDSKVSVTADVDRPDPLRGRKLDLMLATLETGLVTLVAGGENEGHTLRNDYVVRSLRRVAGLAAGGPAYTRHTSTLPLEKDWKKPGLGVAAFLQDPRSLEICGARLHFLSGDEDEKP